MNSIRQLLNPPAQRAAIEMRTVIQTVASDVRQINHSLEELGAGANATAEPAPASAAVDAQAAADGQAVAETREREKQRELATSGPTSATPPTALPVVPDLRPQLEAFMNSVIHNQQATISLLQNFRRLAEGQAAELAELKQQIRGQQNIMSNMRRY